MKTDKEIIEAIKIYCLKKCEIEDTRPSETYIEVKELIDWIDNTIKLNNYGIKEIVLINTPKVI